MKGERGGHTYFVPEKIVDDFVQGEGDRAAVALAFAGGQLAPFRGKGIAILILCFEEAAFLETNAKASLAGMVAAVGAAESVGDVVVDLAVIDDCTLPIKVKTTFVATRPDSLWKLVVSAEPGSALIHVRRASDQCVNRKGLQRFGREALIRRNTVVDKI